MGAPVLAASEPVSKSGPSPAQSVGAGRAGTRLRVLLDAGPAVHQRAGLSRYTERLAAHLLQEQGDRVALTLFHNAHSGHRLPPSLADAPQASLRLGQYPWRLSVLASQLARQPWYEKRLPPSQLYHATEHLLPWLRRPAVLTVHDLIFERYPQHHTWTNRAFLRLGMPLFVKAAQAIIAVSQQTRRDLMALYRVPGEKIHVVHEGVDARFAPADPAQVVQVRERFSPDRPYLLMVGTLEPRKNHAAALRVLARLVREGFPHRLLIAGGRGWLFQPIQELVGELGLGQRVRFTGYVAEAELPALYTGADALVMPSLYEGFGFPVLEAMACGTPVVCSNVSSLPEVAGSAALLVDPRDEEALLAALRRILTEPGLAEELSRRGREQAARFSWSRCAEETVAVYQAVVQEAAGRWSR